MTRGAFVELELHGPSDQAVAFVEGIRLACDYTGPVWFAGRERIELCDLLDTLRQNLGRGTHVILERALAEHIAEALAASEVLQLKVASIEEIDHVEMKFEFECYSKSDATEVRQVIENDLPKGVRLEGYRHREKVDESARGTELYSPTHHYTAQGRGRYIGPVEGVISMAHRLVDQDFIHPSKIRMHHRR